MKKTYLVLAFAALTAWSVLADGLVPQFFDDFSGPALNPIWETNLPNAYSGAFPYGSSEIATYIGAPNYSFQMLGTNTVLLMTNTMGPLQRVGWDTVTNFAPTNFYYEARFNSMTQSPTSSIDGFIEIWIMDAANSNRYDIVSPFSGSSGAVPSFFVGSSIDGSYVESACNYSNNTWYRLVLQCLPGQNIRASLYSDSGTELIGTTLAHDVSAYGSGFKLVLSQTVGTSGSPYPTDVSVDYVELTTGFAPVIADQPANQAVASGGTANFSVTASGVAPLCYQWSFSGTNIDGATNALLTLNNVQPGQAGSYAVTITNIYGSAQSSNATLTVILVPIITSFSPALGTNGTVVNITGLNFDPTPGNNIVRFGAVQAVVSAASATSLTVTVPAGATFAPITETVNGLTAYSDTPFLPTFVGNGPINTSSLASPLSLSTAGSSGSLIMADLNGDGKLDVIVDSDNPNTLSIFQNISTNSSISSGSFGPRIDLPLPCAPVDIAFADVDGDGKLDILLRYANCDEVCIFRNISTNGTLTTNSFAAPVTVPAGSSGNTFAVQDLNGDGKPDIVVANGTTPGTISIYQNQSTPGNIVFAAPVVLATANNPSSVAIGDLDGDGYPDIAVANYSGNSVSILRNLGTGGNITTNSFATHVDIPTIASCYTLALGDMDGDGKLELVVGGTLSSQEIAVLRNTSTSGSITTNSFAVPVTFPAGAWVDSVALGDINGDGKLDVVIACQESTKLSIFQNKSVPGSFTTGSLAARVDYPAYSSGSDANSVVIGDLLGDGRPDIAMPYIYSSILSVYQNTVPFGGPPVITTQPANQAVAVGNNATFSVSLSTNSSLPLSYQWNFGGTNIIGGTNATLTLSNVQLSQAGSYAVTVTNTYGSTISSNATLTVGLAPAITTQPASQTNLVGTSATFTVFATGSTPLSYQWKFGGANIIGATNTTLTLTNVQLTQTGNYAVLVANAFGSILSSNAMLTVVTPPTITTQPANQTVVVGQPATFTVVAGGTAPNSYQWSFGGTNLPNATSSVLVLPNAQFNQAGNYAVTVTSIYGSVLSSNATLAVNPLPPCDPAPSGLVSWWPGEGNADDIIGINNGITTNLTYANGEVGQAFEFNGSNAYVRVPASSSLNVGAGSGFTVECWINPADISVQRPIVEWNSGSGYGAQLWISAAVPYGNGPGCLFANLPIPGANHIISSAAGLIVTNQYQHVAFTYNESSGLAVLYLNGAAVAQQNLGIQTPVTTYDLYFGYRPPEGDVAHYWIGSMDEVSLYNRPLSSNEITAIYNADGSGKCPMPLVITSQPASQTNLLGQTAAFNVGVSGSEPIGYQWSFGGATITDATNATLTLTNVQLNQAGNYSVQVNNPAGSTNSAIAVLTVVQPPVITTQPASQTVLSYQSASFNVAVSGTGPLSYQWQKNGANLVDGGNISGSATTTLTLASVSLNDAGNYVVVVSNPYAATNSAPAMLTVPQTVMMLGSTNGMSGTTIMVPVLMNALGVESAFETSVGYDPAKLVLQSVQVGQDIQDAYLLPVYSQTNNGYVGFAIFLNSGETVPAGTQEVAELTFLTLSVTNTTTVNVAFGDNPDVRQLLDNNLDSLPAIYQGGIVTLSPAEYEADVYPRTNGDHQVNLQDWGEEGRMVAGLDVPTNSDEMLRADCAPRGAPDGVLTVADWVQAGRYAVGLDPLTLVTPPATSEVAFRAKPMGLPAPSRILQVGTVSARRGQTISVPVQLVCTTNENAVGFTVGFNTNQLILVGVTLGTNAAGSRLNVNTIQAGEAGVALALSPGLALKAGTNQVAVLQFTTSANSSGPAALTLNDSVVKLQVADMTANVLAAAYVNGAVVLPPQPALTVSGTGANLQLTWSLGTGTFQVLSANTPLGPWSPLGLPLFTNGDNVGVTVSPTNQQQYFMLQGQ